MYNELIKIFFQTFSRFKGKNNKIYLIKNGIKKKVLFIEGIKIHFEGNNNTISITSPISSYNSYLSINGNNCKIEISSNAQINRLKIYLGGIKNKVIIGENFFNSENALFCAGGGKQDLIIGNNCLFSRNISIYAHDGHRIFNKDKKEIINDKSSPTIIGNHVWLGHGVFITKGIKIPNETIVGLNSVVTKSFIEESTILAGNPVKIIKTNIYFEK